jgi:glycosyltransferase involved in cell wall biosynthesis
MPEIETSSATAEGAFRILMIAPTSFFADYGCHVRILEEARYLQSQGHQVAIATYHNGRDPKDLTIYRTLPIPWRTGYEVGSSRHKIAFDLLLGARSALCMPAWRPDIIHSHLHEGALIGLALSKLCGCPLVCDMQGSLTAEMVDHGFVRQGSRAYRAFYRLETFINCRAPHILTSTQQTAQLLLEEFGCAPERVSYVPDCVNTDVFAPPVRDDTWRAYKAALGIPPERMVVAYLGLLADYQGTGHLLQAAAILCRQRDDLHFLIAGFPNVDRYQEQANQLGIGNRCTFTGRVPYGQAPNVLGLGDVAVSPKLSSTEGAGKLLNYMAVGLPTVAFDLPVSREYLGYDGIYAKAGDSNALAQSLALLLDDAALRREMAERLRRRAQRHYAWTSSGELILEIYRALCNDHSRKRRSR